MSDTQTMPGDTPASAQPVEQGRGHSTVQASVGDITNETTSKVIVPLHGITRVPGRNGGTLTPFTSATSREANDKRMAANRSGVMDAIYGLTGTDRVRAAARELAKPLVQRVLDGGKGIAADYNALQRSAGLSADDRQGQHINAGTVNVVNMTFTAPSMSVEEMSQAARAYLEQQAQAGAE